MREMSDILRSKTAKKFEYTNLKKKLEEKKETNIQLKKNVKVIEEM